MGENQLASILLRRAVSGLPFSLNCLVHLLAMNWYVCGRIDAQSNLVTTYVDNRNDDVIANDNALVSMSRKDQHLGSPSQQVAAVAGLLPTRRATLPHELAVSEVDFISMVTISASNVGSPAGKLVLALHDVLSAAA